MDMDEKVARKIEIALIQQETSRMSAESDAIMAESKALLDAKHALSPSGGEPAPTDLGRYQAIEVALEQLHRRPYLPD